MDEDLFYCPFCGKTISDRYPYFTYKNHEGQTMAAHYDCDGIKKAIVAQGLFLKFNEIAFSGESYGD